MNMRCWCGLAIMHYSRSMTDQVSTWMGDCMRVGKPSWYVASQPPRSTQPSTLRGMVK